MKKKRKYKQLTQNEYIKIKAVIDAGVPVRKAVKFLNRAYSTVHAIKHSKNFLDYKEKLGERFKRCADKMTGKAESQHQKSSGPIVTELKEMKKILISIDTTMKKKGRKWFRMQ